MRSEVTLGLVLQRCVLLIALYSPYMAGQTWKSTSGAKSGVPNPEDVRNLGPSPVFDDFTIREVEVTEGQTLLLPCTVRYLGDKVLLKSSRCSLELMQKLDIAQVSWIRSKDLHVLTSGPVTFTSDNRFEPVPSPGGDFYGLRIRGSLLTDTGQYECQVNTDPKMSLSLNLTVSGARATFGPDEKYGGAFPSTSSTNSKWVGQALIKGPNEVYVRDGSPVTFTCEISPLSAAASQQRPRSGVADFSGGVFMMTGPKVRWLLDDKELLFDDDDTSMRSYIDRGKVIGVLMLSKASWAHSGRYTCLQMSVKPDSIRLFILESKGYLVEDEHTEAMQRDFPSSAISSTSLTSQNSQPPLSELLMIVIIILVGVA